MNVTAVGKIEDIFEHRGMTRTDHTTNNNDGIEKTRQYVNAPFFSPMNGRAITLATPCSPVSIFLAISQISYNLGTEITLEYFDAKLPEIMAEMKEDDILFITADHGCDPTTPSTDHSREYVPLNGAQIYPQSCLLLSHSYLFPSPNPILLFPSAPEKNPSCFLYV